MVCIAGWGHTKFGRLSDQSLEDLIVEAGRQALANAGIAGADVDGMWLGHFNAGMVDDGFASSLMLSIDPGLQFKPATRLENACASGSAAVHAARQAILAGDCKVALVVGVEKMTHLPGADVTAALGRASYQKEEAGISFPGIFAQFAQAYFNEFGDHSMALAKIAAKNHGNSVNNPLAQLQKPLDLDFCATESDRNPMIAAPLKKTDCSLVSDGAAAVVLVAEDMLSDFAKAVRFRSVAHVNDLLPLSARKLTDFEGPARAMALAYQRAGISVDNLDVAEVHDCFTIAELLIYEAMGLAPKGQGASVLEDGSVYAGGRLPVNLSGGLKAKGHPVGATGVSMHAMIMRQLTGQADAMQQPGAELGLVFNMGGSGVASHVSILESVKS
ncbi:3-ketoacyl-CoA thiolase [Thalassovita gelatinovora]|uniref:3-ketoacyl-CoA thiolase n=1 Tax=Thalassovita gelatinovora TaxID=53501 RepID=A0A0P1G0J7_THAGE|nr:acetyl-CoA acetyltransferase [Thalassovita gelatinovora]QIZ79909.1 acetyl-CoA acetyltransferase [Thalassovita gelatinovora]CUH66399.1 3-ketoacyl-CoA thiolase [Thalassovita gelatinovora]SER14459.1 acetyl-CoA C-acetyltransferase [Thalassovita gelatinovora]